MPQLLKEIGARARKMLEQEFGLDSGSVTAALLLGTALEREGGYEVALRGGDGVKDGGVHAEDGSWHEHYWIEIESDGGRFIVDITGDRFGFEPVVVWEAEQARERYVPGHPENCRMQLVKHIGNLRFSQEQEALL